MSSCWCCLGTKVNRARQCQKSTQTQASAANILTLNVGGKVFTTTWATLQKCPRDSILYKLIEGRPHADGIFYLDRDSRCFHHILNWLRDGEEGFLPFDETSTCSEVAREAKVLGLLDLTRLLEQRASCSRPSSREYYKSNDSRGTYTQDPERDKHSTNGSEPWPLDRRSAVSGSSASDVARSSGRLTGAHNTPIEEDRHSVTSANRRMSKNQTLSGAQSTATPISSIARQDSPLFATPKEVTLLVWASERSFEWPVLHAHADWQKWTGLRGADVAPLSASDLPPVSGNTSCVESHADTPLSLWKWMRLTNPADESPLFEWVKGCFAGTDNSRPTKTVDVSVPASAFGSSEEKRTVSLSTARVPVTCRLTSAASLDGSLPTGLTMTESVSALAHNLAKQPGGGFLIVTLTARFPLESDSSGYGPVCLPSTCSTESSEFSGTFTRTVTEGTFTRTVTEGSKSKTDENDDGLRGNTTRAMRALKPPRSPFEDVTMVKLIGTGSFGSVFFGHWCGSNVAVKVLQKASTDTTEPTLEAALAASLSHPNLVQTFKHNTRYRLRDETLASIHSGFVGQQSVKKKYICETWIVLEYCDYGTLWNHTQGTGKPRVNIKEGTEIASDVSSAGSYLHSRGIVHGDMSAANVLLQSQVCSKGYICKVCDFGLSRIWQGEIDEIRTLSLGTVTHMPPERYSTSPDKLTPKVDIHAFGILVWQVFTGQIPFEGFTPPQIILAISRGKFPKMPPEMPALVQEMYSQCIAVDPNDRPTFDAIACKLIEAQQLRTRKHACTA